MPSTFLSADFLKIAAPAAGAVVAWFIDRRQHRALEEYQRKEERYRELLKALPGFYTAGPSRQLKQSFLDQVNLCWLYRSDDVIQKAYVFLATVHTDAQKSDQVKMRTALGEFIVAIRRDLFSRHVTKKTDLKAHDFKILSAV